MLYLEISSRVLICKYFFYKLLSLSQFGVCQRSFTFIRNLKLKNRFVIGKDIQCAKKKRNLTTRNGVWSHRSSKMS